jgi:CPA2 family monovalent cation:H+ antiporter-2
MTHLPQLIQDLALILVAAAFVRDFAIASRDYSLEQHFINTESSFVGKTIRLSGLREATKGIVVGIERGGERILNPDSALTIEKDDLLWIVGDRRLIRGLS